MMDHQKILADDARHLPAITQRCIDLYLLSKQPNGEMGGIGWWQTANGYTAIALHDIWSGSQHNYTVLTSALRECERRRPGFINEFNDDTLWWGICCLHIYTIRQDSWFMEKAQAIWKHVRKSVCRRGQVQFRNMDMEGACYWTTKNGEQQVNSITTGLFAELSLRLALLAGENESHHAHSWKTILRKSPVSKGEYIDAARCSLGWIFRCRFREKDAVVLDNILLREQKAQDWTFTYTTGVVVGVSALLYEVTGEDRHLHVACNMAQKAMQRGDWVEENGTLTERGAYGKGTHNPAENNDAVGFKAVLVRHLGVLYSTIARASQPATDAIETAASIKRFMMSNFQSQQERNTNGNGQYGPWWNGPFDMPTSHSQMAVLDVMAAVMLISRST